MDIDVSDAEHPSAFAVLLHPHPRYGGDRLHPLIDGLFRRLPEVSVSAVRFNFSGSSPAQAHDEVVAAVEMGGARWPHLPAVIAGYSFGAAIGATVDEPVVAGWYLVAPPAMMLEGTPIGGDPRPKRILVPENDQFSPPRVIRDLTATWRSTTVETLAGADHFLGPVAPVIDRALGWIESVLRS